MKARNYVVSLTLHKKIDQDEFSMINILYEVCATSKSAAVRRSKERANKGSLTIHDGYKISMVVAVKLILPNPPPVPFVNS